MHVSTQESPANIVARRARNYDHHYRTAGWKAERWTKETVEDFLAYAVEVDKGGYLNGKEVRYALSRLGAPNCEGMKILDYCCGTGITAIYFALCGAQVWAFDASSEAITLAIQSAQMSDVADRVHFEVVDAQSLPYEDGSFDAVFCQSALHIVIDYPQCPHELSRVLKPGGIAVFGEEGLGYNPLFKPIRWLRRRRWVKCGGRPLRYPDIEQFGRPFAKTEIQHFNLLTQAKTFFRGQLNRHGGLRPWARRLLRATERIDNTLLSGMPWLKRYCGAVVVVYTR
ncbi:MAG: class I SAM-dependent methyltransferase [Sedimentisphaerales bacterium]|nr:class I SAM-dependent methyltransferase [Sedimentisphaerales bacterium]